MEGCPLYEHDLILQEGICIDSLLSEVKVVSSATNPIQVNQSQYWDLYIPVVYIHFACNTVSSLMKQS